MSRASSVTRIFVHCSAGFGNVGAIKAHWKSLGWKSVGYHRFIEENGTVHKLSDFEGVVNGVKNYNSTGIHICYQGGVEKNNVTIAKDTRTEAQKKAIKEVMKEALDWLTSKGVNVSKIKILGHRDISPDKNLNGRVDSWERIKSCPSFDAIPEYKDVVKNYIDKKPL